MTYATGKFYRVTTGTLHVAAAMELARHHQVSHKSSDHNKMLIARPIRIPVAGRRSSVRGVAGFSRDVTWAVRIFR